MLATHDASPVARIAPQPGPQTAFLSSRADIALYGGAAFGGKTFALVMEPLRWLSVKGFSCVVFRRTYPEIMNPGGLWDTASEIYPLCGGVARESRCEWFFPKTNVTIKFTHMQHEKDKHAWQGSAIPLICWDELTHFSRSMFMYMLSRNRLQRGLPVKPYIRATCNPDSASWVADFISWWIDDKTGLPLADRAGMLRYMVRVGDSVEWADTAQELLARHPGIAPKSVTFIPAKITDNKIGTANDPGYLSNLQALSLFEREQLLNGNWKVRATSGMIFKRHWFRIVDEAPSEGRTIRYWDRASTPETTMTTKADYTAGVKMRLGEDGIFYVMHVCRLRGSPDQVLKAMRSCADQDGEDCEVWAECDPGQAGVAEIHHVSKHFQDRVFKFAHVNKSKLVRALPMSAQSEAGNVRIVRGVWNEPYLQELESFADWDQVDTKPKELPHDDQVDASTGAYNQLTKALPSARTL